MGSSVRRKGLSAFCLLGLALMPVGALAQEASAQPPAQSPVQSPAREPFPFDWLRHDAAPSTRAAGPTIYPPVESLNDQKRRQQIEPAMEEPRAMAAPAEASIESAPLPEPETVRVESGASSQTQAPTPASRPAAFPAKAKPAPAMDAVEIMNSRSVTLNELKLVSLKDSRKPFIVRPSLKPGQSLTVEIPRDWGCLFLVWTQFSEEPSEQHDGVDLCGDRKINLVN